MPSKAGEKTDISLHSRTNANHLGKATSFTLHNWYYAVKWSTADRNDLRPSIREDIIASGFSEPSPGKCLLFLFLQGCNRCCTWFQLQPITDKRCSHSGKRSAYETDGRSGWTAVHGAAVHKPTHSENAGHTFAVWVWLHEAAPLKMHILIKENTYCCSQHPCNKTGSQAQPLWHIAQPKSEAYQVLINECFRRDCFLRLPPLQTWNVPSTLAIGMLTNSSTVCCDCFATASVTRANLFML